VLRHAAEISDGVVLVALGAGLYRAGMAAALGAGIYRAGMAAALGAGIYRAGMAAALAPFDAN
jgi:hypothetical protein